MASRNRLQRREGGQAMPEYGTLIAFMAITLWIVFQLFGTTISDFLTNFAGQMVTIGSG